jgi:hypothetical protein
MDDCKNIRKNYLADPQAPEYWLYDESQERTGMIVAGYGRCRLRLTYHTHRRFYFGNQDLVDIIGEAVSRNANNGVIGSCTNHPPHDKLDRKHWARDIYWNLDSLKEPVAQPQEPSPLMVAGPNEFAAVPAWAATPPPD